MSVRAQQARETRDRTQVAALIEKQRGLIADINGEISQLERDAAALQRRRRFAALEVVLGNATEDQDRAVVTELAELDRRRSMYELAAQMADGELREIQSWDRALSRDEANL